MGEGSWQLQRCPVAAATLTLAAAAVPAAANHAVTLPPPPACRENLEGEYSGLEHEVVDGVVESLKVGGSVVFCTGAFQPAWLNAWASTGVEVEA
jgi:hypothetical protein